jgi:alanine racemase
MDTLRKPGDQYTMKRSWVEISLPRIEHNLSIIRGLIPPQTEVIAVVKANGYGHGMVEVATKLWSCGVRSFGVADFREGMVLRNAVTDAEITVFGGCDPGSEDFFLSSDLTAALFDNRSLPSNLKVQLKVNTGMGRLGVDWQTVAEVVKRHQGPVTGVYSTFSSSDSNPESTQMQLERFLDCTSGLGIRRHICNSAGLQYIEAHLDAVRPGLALFGIALCEALEAVRPALCWKARILTINELPAGATVGYGRSFRTKRASRIAVLPVGYADGYRRLLSNRGKVKTSGGLAPVVGNVSMDLTTIDVTDLPDVQIEEEVILLDDDPCSELSAVNMARILETIPYEVLTTIGPRVERIYIGG